jgi:vacuolar protein sorting-associated protein 16
MTNSTGTTDLLSKQKLFSMLWGSLDLSKYIVACCPYGGPIAVIRNDRKMLAIHNQQIRRVMDIYTSAGKLINQFQWEFGRIVSMGWTSDERLVCVLESGLIRLYELFGECTQVSMGQVARDFGVLDAIVWESGCVVITAK